MLALERRNLILEKLQEEKRVVVSELSQLYRVSEETIRRDLDKLELEGYAIKSYGGAVINENSSVDMPFNIRKKRNVLAKKRIAELAAGMVRDGDSIMLDSSTTSVAIAKALKDREHLTIITNSIEIMIELADMSGWTIISTGGTMKAGYLALWGGRTEEAIRSYYVDKAFLSCKALNREQGIMDSNEMSAHVKQVMISSARESILAADQSKFDCAAFARIADIRKVSTVLTDAKPAKEWLDYLETQSIKCCYPKEKSEKAVKSKGVNRSTNNNRRLRENSEMFP